MPENSLMPQTIHLAMMETRQRSVVEESRLLTAWPIPSTSRRVDILEVDSQMAVDQLPSQITTKAWMELITL